MQQTAPVTPDLLWDTMTAYQRSEALKAAVDLEVFTKIGEGNKSTRAISEATDASERGIRILCDTLTVMGFLTKENDEYGLTDSTAAFLDKNSPMYLGAALDFIMSEKLKDGFESLTDAVRTGGSVVREEGSIDPESPMWVKFARGMVGFAMPSAQGIAAHLGFEPDRKLKVLDIAAGHGIFGIAIAQAFPNSEIYALDWANVLQVASEHAEKFGVADRHHLIEGSAFDVDFGDGYDVVLVTNFLHHFDAETNTNFLRKVHRSLADGGRVFTLEFVPNDDRVSPPPQAMFSLVMLAGTPAGDAYTSGELNAMFEAAGFSQTQMIPLAPMPQHLLISMK